LVSNNYRRKNKRIVYVRSNGKTAGGNEKRSNDKTAGENEKTSNGKTAGENEKTSARKIICYIVNISMLASIIMLFVTGLIKYPPIQGLLSIEVASIPYTAISTIHDLSGIAMLIFGFFHVIMHLKGMLKTTKSIFNKRSKSKIIVVLAALVLVAAVATSLTYVLKAAKNEDETNDVIIIDEIIEPEPIATVEIEEFISEFKDGVYIGVAGAHNGDITVEVAIASGKIAFIRVLEHSETAPALPEVFNSLSYAIIKNQSTNDVETVSEATYSSKGYLAAVEVALAQARNID
jgi:uncharacterized protein with FMN-binding domain